MFIEELITSKEKVMYILERWEETRESDKLLWLAYMNIFHELREDLTCSDNPYQILKKKILEAPSIETIRRNRQLIQAEGLYQGRNKKERLNDGEVTRATIHSVPIQDRSIHIVDQVKLDLKNSK